LRRFLEGEVLPWFENRKKELANRPLIREQAFGEALDPDKLERLGRFEVHLDPKLERMLTMLLRLKDLRCATVEGRSVWQKPSRMRGSSYDCFKPILNAKPPARTVAQRLVLMDLQPRAGAEGVKTTVHQTLIRGLGTAGPPIRLRALLHLPSGVRP
jgi:hypothetical protein